MTLQSSYPELCQDDFSYSYKGLETLWCVAATFEGISKSLQIISVRVCVCVTLKTNQEVVAWKIIPYLWALKMRGLGGSQELLTVVLSRLESMHHGDQKVDQNFWLL